MFRSFRPALGAWLVIFSAAAAAQSTVEILDAGAAPREPVRYRFESGRSERGTLDMNMQLALSMGGQQVPMGNMPPVRMTLQMRVAEVAADGSARLEFEVLSAGAQGDDPQAAAINESLAGTKGLSGWYQMDTRGQISAGAFKAPEGNTAPAGAEALGDLEQSIQQLAAPFPAEAIGPGARWQVTQKVDSNGMKLTQAVEYTLRSRAGNRVELDVKMINASLDAAAALPPGAKVDSVQLSGGGTTAIALDRLVPTATVDSDLAMSMSMSAQGQEQSLGMNLKMRQAFAPESP